jgi:cyclic beta-1,2-glucan synthetase
MLNPVNQTRTPSDVLRYKTEPYVMAGDVLASAPNVGRGGWSWYTGSAGWMYRAGIEQILGLRRRGATFMLAPCIPAAWPGYEISWRFGSSRYDITVSNPSRRCRGVLAAELDRVAVDASRIPLVDDGGIHRVDVVLGSE